MCQTAALVVLIHSALVKATEHGWAYRSPGKGEHGIPVTGSQDQALQRAIRHSVSQGLNWHCCAYQPNSILQKYLPCKMLATIWPDNC